MKAFAAPPISCCRRGYPLMRWTGLRRLQLNDRVSDPQPHLPAFHIAAVEHEIEQVACFDDGFASVPLDQEIGCTMDVQVGDHATGHRWAASLDCEASYQ